MDSSLRDMDFFGDMPLPLHASVSLPRLKFETGVEDNSSLTMSMRSCENYGTRDETDRGLMQLPDLGMAFSDAELGMLRDKDLFSSLLMDDSQPHPHQPLGYHYLHQNLNHANLNPSHRQAHAHTLGHDSDDSDNFGMLFDLPTGGNAGMKRRRPSNFFGGSGQMHNQKLQCVDVEDHEYGYGLGLGLFNEMMECDDLMGLDLGLGHGMMDEVSPRSDSFMSSVSSITASSEFETEHESASAVAESENISDTDADNENDADALGKQKRTKWMKKEVTALWEGIAAHGNNWRLIKKKSFGHRTYYQVKDKGRRILSSQGWSSGRTKATHDGASEEAKLIANKWIAANMNNSGNIDIKSEEL